MAMDPITHLQHTNHEQQLLHQLNHHHQQQNNKMHYKQLQDQPNLTKQDRSIWHISEKNKTFT